MIEASWLRFLIGKVIKNNLTKNHFSMFYSARGRGQFLTSPICPGSLLQHKAAFWTRFRPLICIIFCCIHTFFENILQNTTLDNHILCCVPTYFENILQNTTLDDHIFFNTDTFVRKHNAKHYSKYHIICYMTHFGIWERSKTDPSAKHTAKRLNT